MTTQPSGTSLFDTADDLNTHTNFHLRGQSPHNHRHHRHIQHASDVEHDRSHIQARESNDFHSFNLRDGSGVDSAKNSRQEDIKSRVIQIVQTVSLIEVVDGSGSPLGIKTQYAPPNTIVLDPESGKTTTVSSPGSTSSGHFMSQLPASESSLLPSSTITSTRFSVSTSGSLQIHSGSTSLGRTNPAYPTFSGTRNGTHPLHANSTSIIQANSTIKPQVFSAQASISHSSSAHTKTSSKHDFSTKSSSRASRTSTATSSTTSDVLNFSTAHHTTPQPTSSSASVADAPVLSPQQKQVIGGVVGGLAGAAVFALLVLLVLRYKRKNNNHSLLTESTSGPAATRALPDSDNTMIERSGSTAFLGALASLTSKRQQPDLQKPSETGFYRVSGRKLPSVLTAGGDGYSNPRESTMSGMSELSQVSQLTDLHDGPTRFALGTPMRPVSGVPIMRSGPARTPVALANPFADPAPHVSTPPTNGSPPRSLGSRESPRPSGSRFKEKI